MRVTEELIHKLARLAETDRTVLSVYLDTRLGWEQAEKFIEAESKRLLPVLGENEKEYFEGSLSFLSDYINKKKSKGFDGPGIAFFADLGANFAGGVELAVPPEPILAVDDEARILQLALELDEYEPVGIIMADASGARILIAAGDILDEGDSLKTKIHHLSKVGGWSQMRYQRRRDKQVKSFAKEVAGTADDIFRQFGVGRILLAGRNRMVKAVENELAEKWRENVIGSISWDLDATDDDFTRKIRPALVEAERKQETEIIGRFVSELRRDGLAVSGIKDTIAALKLGQVDILIIELGLEPELAEELTSLAEAISAHVEFIPPGNDAIAANGGVGALLRYKLRRGR